MSERDRIPELIDVLRGPVPAVAVAFDDRATDAELAELQVQGLDVAELRIDRWASTDPAAVVAEVRRFAAFPTLATIRTTAEGGGWGGSEADRLALFEAILPEVGGIDVELSADEIVVDVVRAARARGKAVVASFHDFAATPGPAALEALVRRSRDLGADVLKVSAMATTPTDLRTMAAFLLAHPDLDLVVIAMGPHGSASRVFFPLLGSCLTYAYTERHPVSGQLTFAATVAELRRFSPAYAESHPDPVRPA